MGQWAGHQFIPAEFRADSEMPADELVSGAFRDTAEAQGYHPQGDVQLDWREILQDEADRLEVAYGFPVVRAGDWRVRGVIEVAEDAELPMPS